LRSSMPTARLLVLLPYSPLLTLLPYTTLFRSRAGRARRRRRRGSPPRSGRCGWRPPATRPPCTRRPSAARNRTPPAADTAPPPRSEEHTSELQSRVDIVCRLLLEKKNVSIIAK